MYSLVIVEDEYATRRALVNMIQWNELGFRVDGEFSDGQELLDYLKNNIPDVILTDIKMTKVSGIEIAKLVAEQNLPIQIVFLSAYKDFSYAQEAVEYRVVYYLLKPVELSKLRGIFRRLKEKLDKQEKLENMLQERVDHYNRLMNYEKQQFVLDTYFGSLTNPSQLQERLRLIDSMHQGKPRLFLVRVVICNDRQYKEFLADYGQHELQERLVHILRCFDKRLEYYAITWSCVNEELSVLGVFWENQTMDLAAYSAQELKKVINNLMVLHVKIPVFYELESPQQLAHCAERVSEKENADDLIADMEYLQLLQDQNKLLYSYLCQNSQERGLELAGTLFDNYLRGGMDFARRQCIYTVMKLLDEVAGNNLMTLNRLYAQCLTPAFFSATRAEAMKEWLVHCVHLLFCFVSEQIENKQNTSIEKVMDYLRQHYSEDITLTNIAEQVFLNPAYISRMIKEQTGKNYTDFVMEMRINQAVELLENSDMYVYKIAEKVGYSNLKYFYKVFRKITGKSPGDYRPYAKQAVAEGKIGEGLP